MNNEIEKIISKLKNNKKVVAIYIFGSYAKRNQKPLSDIDLAVILKEIDPEIEAEIGSMYSREIDLVLFHRLPLHIKYEVFRHGKPLFINDENYLKNLQFKIMREYLETSWLYSRIKNRLKQ